VLDKTGSLPVSFPVQIIYRIVSYHQPSIYSQIPSPTVIIICDAQQQHSVV